MATLTVWIHRMKDIATIVEMINSIAVMVFVSIGITFAMENRIVRMAVMNDNAVSVQLIFINQLTN